MRLQGAGPPGGSDTVFLDSVASTAAQWMGLLKDAAGPATIASEAFELAGIARVRGMDQVSDLLTFIQKLAASRSEGLPAAVRQLAGSLGSRTPGVTVMAPLDGTLVMKPQAPPTASRPPPPPEPAPGQPPPPLAHSSSIPLPPMLDQTSRRLQGGLGMPLLPSLDPAGPRKPTSSNPPAAGNRPPLPDPAAQPAPPQLVVKNMLGLRAFKKDAPAPAGPAVPSAAPRPKEGGVLGLAKRRRAPMQPIAPAPPLDPLAQDTQRRGAVRRPSSARPPARNPRARAVPPWAYLAAGALAVLAFATVGAVLLASRTPTKVASASSASAAGTTPSPSATTAAGAPPRPPGESVDVTRLAETAHQQGPETPELRALIEIETRTVASCRDDPSRCTRGWAKRSREVLDSPDAGSSNLPAPTQGPPSAWLMRLKVPADCGVQDAPSLRGVFDYESKNISGRQQFQQKIFECAAYADIFESTFIKYGAPTWLTAVVFQESGCDPRASSPVGARGLWQFMPDAGRAYGLRVVEDDVDERLNPVKSTEAGVHFLTDLKRKLGSWDLALAAYNMGPFGVATRIAQVGGQATFWDLARAGLLPEETSAYVPAIQAHALILANLGRLQFSSDGKRLESTAEILVRPGTRLSLIARAAATSTLRIRQLNPEFLRDVVPDGEASARVPDAEAHRAQTFLEQHAVDDDRDLCVPEDFEWGVKPFENSKYAAACAHGAPAPH